MIRQILCRAVPVLAFALAPAVPAFAQDEVQVNGGVVSVTEVPDVDYEFGEKEWREKAEVELEQERASRDGTPSQEEIMEAAPEEEKVLTNVDAPEREGVPDDAEVIYRDVGNPEPGPSGPDTGLTTTPGLTEGTLELKRGLETEPEPGSYESSDFEVIDDEAL